MIRVLALLIAGCAAAPAPIEAPAATPDAQVAMASRASATPKPSAWPTLEPAAQPAGWPTPCPPTGKDHVPGHVLVGFAEKATDADRTRFRQAFGVIAMRSILPSVWLVRVPCDADVPALVKKMGAWPGIRYAEPDGIVTLDDPIEGK